MDRQQLIERSIIKKYRKPIWNNFIGGIKDYQLISPGDKIAVCISGGKDSMLLAKCMQHLQKYSDFKFELEYIVMDPGYIDGNRQKIIDNAELLGLPIKIFDTPIFETVYSANDGSPCYLCARMRRGYLYKQARSLGCNKIALGHHFNDVIETTLMSMFYGAEIKTMMPKLKSTNYPGMELIRPLYLVREKDIISWANYNSLQFIRCACKVTRQNAETCDGSKRQEMKELIKHLKSENDNVDMNIFKSVNNVNLSTILGYRKSNEDELHSFSEGYDESE
jgi:tRNA 2-thiocytidine biosynthesis protein TtcA